MKTTWLRRCFSYSLSSESSRGSHGRRSRNSRSGERVSHAPGFRLQQLFHESLEFTRQLCRVFLLLPIIVVFSGREGAAQLNELVQHAAKVLRSPTRLDGCESGSSGRGCLAS